MVRHNPWSAADEKEKFTSWFRTRSFPIIIVALLVLILFSFSVLHRTDEVPVEKKTESVNAVASVKLPDNLSFAGERVPLEYFDVRESLDRELLVNIYWQSQTLLLIKRAEKYFPTIEKILEKQNVPSDFKYLALAESGFMNVKSPAGAVGFWQLMEGTARDYGLTVNEEVDERYHIEKSTEAACVFLKESHQRYGNWTLVAASYNNGRNGLEEQMGIQKNDNYYDLLLNEETARYLFRILSLKLIIENPSAYGYKIDKEDLYPSVRTYKVEITGPVADFTGFASSYKTNYKILKYFNPWLRKPYLTNREGKFYWIELPEEDARVVLK
jgi:membrane-bound lytic murein transglycosylase D